MWIISELQASLSTTASASAPSSMRACHAEGLYCEQTAIEPLPCLDSTSPGSSRDWLRSRGSRSQSSTIKSSHLW